LIVLQADQWRRIGRALFVAAGATESNATRVTESLVDSNLAGHDSHGVARIPQYLQAISSGQLDPAGQPVVVKETGNSFLVDGQWTFGQVGAELAMKRAIQQAREHRIAVAGLIRAHHIGRLGEYSEMACQAGMIGMVMVGGIGGGGRTSGGVAPYGGSRPVFGTNPICFGLPAGSQPPVLSDFATSAVAAGKVSMARAKGEKLPPGCIVDREGNPTTDPEDYYAGGMLLPFGGHKGYGLAVVIELLGQALTGADRCAVEKGRGGVYQQAGNLFIVLDPSIFRPVEEYTAAADAILQRVKAVPPAPGFGEVLLPGELERRSKGRRQQEGIGLPDNSWETLQQEASRLGVDLAALLA